MTCNLHHLQQHQVPRDARWPECLPLLKILALPAQTAQCRSRPCPTSLLVRAQPVELRRLQRLLQRGLEDPSLADGQDCRHAGSRGGCAAARTEHAQDGAAPADPLGWRGGTGRIELMGCCLPPRMPLSSGLSSGSGVASALGLGSSALGLGSGAAMTSTSTAPPPPPPSSPCASLLLFSSSPLLATSTLTLVGCGASRAGQVASPVPPAWGTPHCCSLQDKGRWGRMVGVPWAGC